MSTYRIGIDAGGTKVAYGLFDEENRLLDRFQQPTPTEADGPTFCGMVIDSIHTILEKNRLTLADLAGIGVCMPSFILFEQGYVCMTSAMVNIRDFAMRDYLAQRLGVPIVLDNDSNVAALAEHRFGAGQGSRHMIYMAVSTGIGSGLILNGQLFRGSYGWAGSAVGYLYSNQVVSGVGGTRYGPSRAIKRGDFALMLCKAFGLESYSVGSGFADVPNSAYYANAVGTLKDLGVVSGDGRRFRPTDSVTRQDAMVMLQKAMQSAGWTLYDGGASSLNSFQDGSNTSAYARGAVACMVQMGILSGDSQGRLNPRGTLNRAEMAVVLHKAMTY